MASIVKPMFGTQMQTVRHPSVQTQRALRWLAATAVVALAAGFGQAAMAQAPRGPGGFGMAMAPHAVDRMLDAVNASADQRAQIKQIIESARSDLKSQRDSGGDLRDQARELFAQPTVDARAAEALRQQMLAQHDAASKRVLQAMIDVSRVLTPEQRKSIADRLAQRRAMMERHRAERQSVAPATR